ncbi:hypothetical protein QJS10_CPA02g00231 [Acorus calamus]|uniref:ACT domain-containing protein ACR n=1 Tax=Acorus calamus TaxID=4465 RepID=A0AAV9FDT9_ACOCL|nr:hypothetical protein QJS10_CPA02g00231 [Acorus calamus]
MKKICWPYYDPEFEKLEERINGPSCRVSVDNESCNKCTVVKVDSVNKQGLLLEVVAVLTDMDLSISKGYISSDAGWFMDVFHVRDQMGNKITNQKHISYLQESPPNKYSNQPPKTLQALSTRRELDRPINAAAKTRPGKTDDSSSAERTTTIEMSGADRPGLFSEISAVLADLRCNVVEAHAWSHNACLACVAYVSDQSTSARIDDPSRLASIKDHLSTVLRAVETGLSGCAPVSMTHAERRLHQLMLANRDFDGCEERTTTAVSIERCEERGYSVVFVDCLDRARLMFDTVCTLTDMEYVVFHASVTSDGNFAHQASVFGEHRGEKQLIEKCLEAAIERRVCEGVRLELCTNNQAGLLSYVTRVFREYGLTVVRADVETRGKEAVTVFYVRDISGREVDMGMVEAMRREVDLLAQLRVKNEQPPQRANSFERSSSLSPSSHFSSIGEMLRSQIERFSHNFISIN